MAISVRDRKILWTRARNQCAFPGCRQELVQEGGNSGIVVGQEVHIVARSPGGPRGHEPKPERGVDSYENILVLCPTHHTIVDSAPEIYTKQAMIDMKHAHETRLRLEQGVPQSWLVGESMVVLDLYGSPPIPHGDRWRVSGVQIGQRPIRATDDVRWLFDSTEADPEIEFWSADSRFYIVQSTFFLDDQLFSPFVRHEFDFTEVPASSRVELLVKPDPSLVQEVPRLLEEIESHRSDELEMGLLDDLLYQIWRAGLNDPQRVCEELGRFKDAPWCDGMYAETVTSMMDDLVLVQRARASG